MQHAGKYGAAADKRWHECPDSCEIYAYPQFSTLREYRQEIFPAGSGGLNCYGRILEKLLKQETA